MRAGRPLRGQPGRRACFERRSFCRSGAALAAALLILAAPSRSSASAPGAAGEDSPRTEPRVEVLRRLVDLASKDRFYLIVEPHEGVLTLMYRGLVARSYAITSTEIGRRRVAFIPRPLPSQITAAAWSGGRLDPLPVKERHTLSVNSQGERQGPEPPLLPPTPEEAVPAPPGYRLVFEGGMELEIRPDDPDAKSEGPGPGWLAALLSRCGDVVAALDLGGEAPLRVRLRMPAGEAASLYRGLPPQVDLVILAAAAGGGGHALLR